MSTSSRGIGLLFSLVFVVAGCGGSGTGTTVADDSQGALSGPTAAGDPSWIVKGRAYTNDQYQAYEKGNVDAADQVARLDCSAFEDTSLCKMQHFVTSAPDLTTRTDIVYVEAVNVDPRNPQPICDASDPRHPAPWGTVTFRLLQSSNPDVAAGAKLTYDFVYLCKGQQLNLKTPGADDGAWDFLARDGGS